MVPSFLFFLIKSSLEGDELADIITTFFLTSIWLRSPLQMSLEKLSVHENSLC